MARAGARRLSPCPGGGSDRTRPAWKGWRSRCEWPAESANSPKPRGPCRRWTEPDSESQSFRTILPCSSIVTSTTTSPWRPLSSAAATTGIRRHDGQRGADLFASQRPFQDGTQGRACGVDLRGLSGQSSLVVHSEFGRGSSRLADFFALARCLHVRRVLNCCCVAASEVPGEASLTTWVL